MPVIEAAEQLFRWHAIDVRMFVSVAVVGNSAVASSAPLDAIEDDAEKDDEEQGTQSCA